MQLHNQVIQKESELLLLREHCNSMRTGLLASVRDQAKSVKVNAVYTLAIGENLRVALNPFGPLFHGWIVTERIASGKRLQLFVRMSRGQLARDAAHSLRVMLTIHQIFDLACLDGNILIAANGNVDLMANIPIEAGEIEDLMNR